MKVLLSDFGYDQFIFGKNDFYDILVHSLRYITINITRNNPILASEWITSHNVIYPCLLFEML